MSNKSLAELGEEYEIAVKEVEAKIAICAEKLKQARKAMNADEVFRLEKLLNILDDEKLELLQKARQLKNYYKK